MKVSWRDLDWKRRLLKLPWHCETLIPRMLRLAIWQKNTRRALDLCCTGRIDMKLNPCFQLLVPGFKRSLKAESRSQGERQTKNETLGH